MIESNNILDLCLGKNQKQCLQHLKKEATGGDRAKYCIEYDCSGHV